MKIIEKILKVMKNIKEYKGDADNAEENEYLLVCARVHE